MALPNFLVVGVGKAGTTSLYHYLGQHPEIGMSRIKEPRFLIYAGHCLAPEKEYTATFRVATLQDYEAQYAPVADRKVLGDISPTYIMHPELSILGIRQYVPNAKMIIIYRQPADRGYSNYLMHVRMGDEPLPTYEAALAAEKAGLPRFRGQMRTYFDRGFYAQRTLTFLNAFPKNQFLFLLYDDLVRDTNALLETVFRFLDVDPTFRPDTTERHNAGSWPTHFGAHRVITSMHPWKRRLVRLIPDPVRNPLVQWFHAQNLRKPPRMDPALRAELTSRYKDDIVQLQKIIGRDLSGWLAAKQ
jgi:hypothetical protein